MDIAVGQKATGVLTLTAAHVKTFAELTDDYNPLHIDENFVAIIKFKRQGGFMDRYRFPAIILIVIVAILLGCSQKLQE